MQYIFKDVCTKQPGEEGGGSTLKVGKLNEMLDTLVEKPKLEEKAEVLRALIHMTTPEQMMFITHIILGDLKVCRRLDDCVRGCVRVCMCVHACAHVCMSVRACVCAPMCVCV